MTRVSDVIEARLWPDTEPTTLAEIQGKDVKLLAAEKREVASKYSESGKHDAYFVLLREEGGRQLNLLVSQQVLMGKLDQLVAKDAFPITGAFVKNGRYWDLI